MTVVRCVPRSSCPSGEAIVVVMTSPSRRYRGLDASRLKNSFQRVAGDSRPASFPAILPGADFTHWPLAGGADAEIINWLDDHSRYLLACSACAPVTGKVVVDTFLQAGSTHGLPASTLTDNGRVYTARFGGGRNAFEYLLAALGITQKNGQPFHPQTQGKVERFQCATRRVVVSPAQPGGTRREVPGSDGLPDAERLRGQEHAS
jgi:transposase InsO family protein